MHTPVQALEFLKKLDAPPSLILHAELVSKTAAHVLKCLNLPPEIVNEMLVLTGAILHDAGKIQHPEELTKPGHLHEMVGYHLLLHYQFPVEMAEMCITHYKWQYAASLEALIVALADRLWKGKRVLDLESHVIRKAAEIQGKDFGALYGDLQPCFDVIAEDAPQRLERTSSLPNTS